MGGQFPPLTPSEVEEILKNAGFHLKRLDGSHFQWEGDIEGQRRMVTVDHLGGRMSETFGPELTRSYDQTVWYVAKNLLQLSKINLTHQSRNFL
jgi:predicted RNA binding protein YcfA (HicA-like mRNA interferase family)